jgi:hypothetical protein
VDRGCEQDSPIPGRWKIRDISFQRCPLKVVTQESREYLRAYDMLEMNTLPHGKGYLHESQAYIDAMRTIRAEVADMRMSEIKKTRTENVRG